MLIVDGSGSDGGYARGNWSETKILERCQKDRKGQNFKRILNLSNRAKWMSSVRQESQSKRLLQVKVYSGIIMPEIQRMTRCGIVFQSVAMWCCPLILKFKFWVILAHICIMQAHWESWEGATKIASQGFVELKQVGAENFLLLSLSWAFTFHPSLHGWIRNILKS